MADRRCSDCGSAMQPPGTSWCLSESCAPRISRQPAPDDITFPQVIPYVGVVGVAAFGETRAQVEQRLGPLPDAREACQHFDERDYSPAHVLLNFYKEEEQLTYFEYTSPLFEIQGIRIIGKSQSYLYERLSGFAFIDDIHLPQLESEELGCTIYFGGYHSKVADRIEFNIAYDDSGNDYVTLSPQQIESLKLEPRR